MSFDFPPSLPQPPPSQQSPRTLPGITVQSTNALRVALKENNDRFHIFFNDKHFHNHTTHHIIALWALGASGPVIDAAYKLNADYQRPKYEPPEPITDENYNEHLGDEKYYTAYFIFFADLLSKRDRAEVIEEYIFSSKVNFDPSKEGQAHPQMFCRFVSGLFHPLIHIGYGVEFGIHGMLAEGLAQAAVHLPTNSILVPASHFHPVSLMAEELPSLSLDTSVVSQSSSHNVHALTVLARMLKDPRLKIKKPADMPYQYTLDDKGELIKKYAQEWTVDISGPEELYKKIEELIWANAIIYAIGGWNLKRPFRAEFVSMHLVTSSIFLPSIAAFLSTSSQVLLLRTYFSISLAYWVSRGRVGFDIPAFFSETTINRTPPGPQPTPSSAAIPSPSDPAALTPNAWAPLIQSCLVHPGEHVCKIQRAFEHFATLYGTRSAASGECDLGKTELPGAESLDGTLFLRAAYLTADAVGWVREGQEAKDWSSAGFYDE